MGARESVSVPGTLAGIHEAISAFEAWSDRQGTPIQTRRSLQTALDEVLANIVHHGFRGALGRIDLTFSREDGAVAVEVADTAAPFNPLLAAAPDTTAALDERPIGGLGIALLKALVDEVRYERRGDENRLTMVRRL
jgi:anti-sigma regulatory factor (Ser/Thr protein kinase)